MKSAFIGVALVAIHLSSLLGQIADKAEDVCPLLVGESLLNGKLQDVNGNDVMLHDILSEKPTVLIFYRGGWCPYCNLHLSAVAGTEEEIIKLGYQIVAISPDDFNNLKSTIKEDKLNYKVYSDPQGKLIQQIGLAYRANEKTKEYISKKTIGTVTDILPVPALMLINSKSEIVFEYINPNYKTRISPELLLAVLKNSPK